ncbi:DUF2878 domain-containing protein [Parendozoicomonas haliclonae]|uniref:DUF2878 domain-containing protein n=1 Tax=Parendozoicomonas haliclonae TaxID=1960125 RepID=A0A1X7ANB4_9GAMM|nr:DUF2878 domain-containing protein [Parendozoicomonas haliclonae]SMA49584.1 hypothetical protein EHSB41UT_03370 [Parendozoicomonas haliclonae]
MLEKHNKLINFILFQVGWFACVLGGNTIALATTIAILAVHLTVVTSWKKERELLVVTLLVGSAIDSFLGNLNILQFPGDSRVLPLWLACLWVLFGTTLRHSMDWTGTHKLLGSLGGMIAGPLSYLAGSKLSDISLAQPQWQTLLILAVIWALVIPMLQTFSAIWLEKYQRTQKQP